MVAGKPCGSGPDAGWQVCGGHRRISGFHVFVGRYPPAYAFDAFGSVSNRASSECLYGRMGRKNKNLAPYSSRFGADNCAWGANSGGNRIYEHLGFPLLPVVDGRGFHALSRKDCRLVTKTVLGIGYLWRGGRCSEHCRLFAFLSELLLPGGWGNPEPGVLYQREILLDHVWSAAAADLWLPYEQSQTGLKNVVEKRALACGRSFGRIICFRLGFGAAWHEARRNQHSAAWVARRGIFERTSAAKPAKPSESAGHLADVICVDLGFAQPGV